MEALFEQATRIKLRFPTTQGMASIEDLWDLPLTSNTGRANLDDLAKDLNRAIKESSEESFVVEASKASTELELAFEIVKHVIKVRLAENEEAKAKAANKAKKQRILELVANKQDKALEDKPLEELLELANSL